MVISPHTDHLTTSPGDAGARGTLQGPRTYPREAPRAGLSMTTVGIPSARPGSHSAGAISEPALGRVCPGPGLPAATHWSRLQTLLSHLPRLQTTWEETEARELARLLSRRRDPQVGLVSGSLCWDRRGKDTTFSFPPAAPGRGGRGGGECLPQSQPPCPCDPATVWLETSPCRRSGGNGPSRHPGPHPTGQRPPQLILPAGLSLRLPPAPTATALGPEPALRKNSCEPGWLQKPGEPGLDSPVQAWALLPGPNSTGPQAGEEAEVWRRGRTSAGTRAELTGRQEVPPTRPPVLPAVEATAGPPGGLQSTHSNPLTSGSGIFPQDSDASG